MPRVCTICTHDERHLIDVALVHRESFRTIAHQRGVSVDALKRHSKDHLPELLVEGYKAVEAAEAGDLLAELRSEKEDVQRLKSLAEGAEDYRTALLAVDKALKALELQAKVAQLIDTSPKVNILIAPQVQQVIIDALRPYPEARLSVANALEALETTAVHDGS